MKLKDIVSAGATTLVLTGCMADNSSICEDAVVIDKGPYKYTTFTVELQHIGAIEDEVYINVPYDTFPFNAQNYGQTVIIDDNCYIFGAIEPHSLDESTTEGQLTLIGPIEKTAAD